MTGPVVEVNPDPIPDELKDRDQWLLWDSSHDTPRQPHWAGKFGISWSDPDDWHSFEDALELAESRDSWGIGYVMALTNDDHPRSLYGCLDLDGCLDEDGQPKDWVPDMSRFGRDGAYAERSPSGDGLHIPLVGQQPPEWWTDCHFSEEEHEGVEYLTHKFCTFTGDAIQIGEDESDGVADTNPAPFLHEAYHTITGEYPQHDTEGTADTGDRDWTEDDVAELLDHVGSGCGYAKWRNLAFAVHDWDDSHTGKSLFEQWSRGSGWDDGSQRLIDAIWNNSEQGSGLSRESVTFGTLVYHAKQNGWSGSARTKSEGGAVGDGGTQTATADAQPAAGPEWKVDPRSVLRVALSDVRIPLETDDDEDVTLRDLRQSEAAYATWKVLEKTGFDRRLLGVHGGAVYGCDGGVWSRETGDELFREKAVDALGPAFTKGVKADMEEHLRRAQTYLADELGAPDAKVATKTGLLNLEELEEERLKPSHLALHRIPHDFDEGANGRPQFDQFISDSVKESDRKKLQEYAGYLLWHHAQPYGKALFLVGPTDSGKGTFLRVLKGVIGRQALASESLDDLTESRWGAAQLYGSWANIRNEVTPGEVKKVERFKELTGGGDRISAEFKGEQKFEFDVTQKFIFSMNQMPEVSGADGAFWNRLLFAEFPDTVAEEDKIEELAAKIVDEEGSAVLNWMLDGLQRLRDNSGQFTNERDTDAKKELCNAFGGPFDRFIQDVVDQTGDDGHWVDKRDLFELAEAYANYKDMEPEWSNQGHFTRMLGREGVRHDRTRHVSEDGDKIGIYQGVQVPSWAVEELDVGVNQGATLGAEEHESGTQSTL
jgi:putative DNA primase/helicase